LKGLGVSQPLIDETIAIAATTKEAVLTLPKKNLNRLLRTGGPHKP